MFICGSGSFNHEDDQTNEGYNSPCRTPKRSKRTTSFCRLLGKDNTNKNPYANRGLDKFYALLADLDDKKQKIYTQKGSEDISFVRFVYTNGSDHAKPIVVKVKEKKGEKVVSPNLIKQSTMNNHESDKITQSTEEVPKAEVVEEIKGTKKKYSLRCNGSFKMENLKRPYFYFPVMVVLILLFLVIHGRSFAILCTSIGWYLVPSIVGGSGGRSSSAAAAASSDQRKPKRKKDQSYVRKQSDKKIIVHGSSEGPSSPKSVINGLTVPHRRSL
ncbi:hypothetical protein BUALT_Bualt08G0044100 [Buddleja alternifolia]|uniref:ZCF37 n=1 Tax=Buddleja alternifolia TaxID=168488 RepID=A0AAV6XEK7_9LAMI|nr:hypothetical protein BUALT_Bualt08G0044100 [Buddleja alternifolia]